MRIRKNPVTPLAAVAGLLAGAVGNRNHLLVADQGRIGRYRPAGNERSSLYGPLAAVDVEGRAGDGGVGHEVDGQGGDAGRANDTTGRPRATRQRPGVACHDQVDPDGRDLEREVPGHGR